MNKIRIRCPALFLLGLILLLWQDHTGIARLALLASILHEAGHVLIFWLIHGHFPLLTLTLNGISLQAEQGLTSGELFLLAAAGPISNFVACSVMLLAINHRASYWGYFFACTNLCMGLFNLIPLGPLDGKRMFQALRMKQLEKS